MNKRTSDFADILLAALQKGGHKASKLAAIPDIEPDSYRSPKQMVEIYARTHARAGKGKRNKVISPKPVLPSRFIYFSYE